MRRWKIRDRRMKSSRRMIYKKEIQEKCTEEVEYEVIEGRRKEEEKK
jgi:hypothetical protein